MGGGGVGPVWWQRRGVGAGWSCNEVCSMSGVGRGNGNVGVTGLGWWR